MICVASEHMAPFPCFRPSLLLLPHRYLDQLHRGIEYTMEIAQGKDGLFVGETPVIRTHAWRRADASHTNVSKLASCSHLWRKRAILKRRCSVRRGRLVDSL